MPTFRHESGIPVLTGDPQKDIAGLRNAMYSLEEELRYMFNNLDEGNLGTGLSSILKETIGDVTKSTMFEIDVDGIVAEVKKKVGGDYAELTAKVELTASGLTSVVDRVGKLEDSQGTVDENLKTEIVQSAKEVTLSAVALTYETKTDAAATKTALEASFALTASGILTEVSQNYETKTDADAARLNLTTNYYNKSTIDQKVDSIKLSVNTNGKKISLTLNGETQEINLEGYVTFTNLSTSGQTTIDGGNIKTGTISAERLDLSSRENRSGYIFETLLSQGMLLSIRHTGNLLASGNAACALDPVEGLSLGTYGEAYGEIYTSGEVLKIKGKGGIHLNDKAFPGGFSLSEFNNNLKLSSFQNDLSIGHFTNNAIAMATAYTTSVLTGGGDITMSSITEMDSVGVFSRDRYSSSYGYGIKCSKAGYYLVSAHASLKSSGTVTPTTAIRKVTGGTSTYIAKATDYVYCNGSGTFPHSHQIAPKLIYLEANSYLSLYVHDSACSTTADGCWISAVYLGI